MGLCSGPDTSAAGIASLLFTLVSTVLYAVALGTNQYETICMYVSYSLPLHSWIHGEKRTGSPEVNMGVIRYCTATCQQCLTCVSECVSV